MILYCYYALLNIILVQLLERGCIKGDVEGNVTLLDIVPGPVQQYFPQNSKILGKKRRFICQ